MAWTGCVPVGEDNARFLLLGVVLLVYMGCGALLFQRLEQDNELAMESTFWLAYGRFREHYLRPRVNCTELMDEERVLVKNEEDMDRLHALLYAYGNASSIGIIHKRRRWDFIGSFHFVTTIVSTIGYGNITPQTTEGKAVVIIYGLLGCSGGILFFNLFLERIITFLAFILRTIHLRRIKKRMKNAPMSMRRTSTVLGNRRISRISRSSLPDILDDDEETNLENWKPSVYWVMLSLSAASCVVGLVAAAVYAPFENWTYFEAIYFCFVSFATIGFGDYVATQEENYPNAYLYRTGHFIFLALGCCCIYSLLNVTSIVIKQALNWMILKLQCRWKDDPMSAPGRFWRRHSVMLQRATSVRNRRRRSSAAIPHNARKIRRSGMIRSFKKPSRQNGTKKDNETDTDSGDSDASRRNSGELISMKDFLKANKVSLAVMQKQLYETAQMQRGGCVYHLSSGVNVVPYRRPPAHSFTPGMVGPLAIVSEKLGENVPPR